MKPSHITPQLILASASPRRRELLQRIGIVRSRWKAFLWVRGLAWVLGVAVASMLIGLALMNTGNISAWTVNGVRLGVLAAIIFTALAFLPISRLAFWFLVPYGAWVGFASVLNFEIWRLNRDTL